MSLRMKEWEVKLELIASLAKSQTAMARILESVAGLAEDSPAMARSIRDNIHLLTGLQQNLAEQITGVKLGRPREGGAGSVWLRGPELAVRRSGLAEGRQRYTSVPDETPISTR